MHAQMGMMRMKAYPMINQCSSLRDSRGCIHRKATTQTKVNRLWARKYSEYSVGPGRISATKSWLVAEETANVESVYIV